MIYCLFEPEYLQTDHGQKCKDRYLLFASLYLETKLRKQQIKKTGIALYLRWSIIFSVNFYYCLTLLLIEIDYDVFWACKNTHKFLNLLFVLFLDNPNFFSIFAAAKTKRKFGWVAETSSLLNCRTGNRTTSSNLVASAKTLKIVGF